MSKTRMEAFSDGVLAIIITIMVLELTAPHEPTLAALRPLLPTLSSYVLSFIFVGIYWNNHHHLLQAIKHVDGRVLWANLHLLFWLSLVPFVTAWMGETNFAAWPVALYGTVMTFAGTAYFILAHTLIAVHGRESALAAALGADYKGKVSIVIWMIAIPLAFVSSWLACGLFVLVAVLWLIPDRRIERTLAQSGQTMVVIAILATTVGGSARAEVIETSETGFLVKNEELVNAAPLKVYSALLEQIDRWWDPDHTYSGDSRNLSIDPKPGGCFCERLPGNGGVQHLTVVMLSPGRELRLTGALGPPLQEAGLTGSLSWKLSESGGSTRVVLTYSVGGFRSGGLRSFAAPVDSVLRGQLLRLKRYVETGRPN